MIPNNVDPLLQHFFPEQDEPLDFQKIAAETNRSPSAEVRKILNHREPDFADFGEMMANFRLGIPLPAASSSFAKSAKSGARIEQDGDFCTEYGPDGGFVRCWIGSPTERPDFESLHKSAEFQAADTLLTEYQRTHGSGVPLEERLGPLVERACTLLSADLAQKLRKALRALDIPLIHFLFEKAFLAA
jgi:hypothetical protein